MEDKKYRAQRGDVMLFMAAKPWIGDEEMMLMACHWSLARVTAVTPDGDVSAYRTFGTHFVSRDVAGEHALLSSRKVDVQALENDMNARVAKRPDANEFGAPDYAYEFVKTFVLEEAKNGV